MNTISNESIPNHLTSEQALSLLKSHGPNVLPDTKKITFWTRSAKLLQEPMILLLVATASIYLIMGDLEEGLMLGISVFVVIGISMYQERKSEKALQALKQLSSPRALVIRNGQEKRVPAAELVPGDLISLHEGDRVPADGIVLQQNNLNIDESLLTGESFPVKKRAWPNDVSDQDFSDLDNQTKVYSSTLVISGTAYIRVIQTGNKTEVGKIGQSLNAEVPDDLNLAKEIRHMVKIFAWAGGITCLAIIFLYGLSHQNWLQAFLVGLATQMALLPEEFPVVLTIFLAMGAWRLSKLQVLVRKPSSIERLGAISVLCVDKTGTLTLNQMSVVGLYNGENSVFFNDKTSPHIDEKFHQVAEFAVLASHRDPFDPMEKAIRRLLENAKWGQDHIHHDWQFIRDYPLSEKLFAMSCVWKDPNENSYIIAAKGAPEAILDLCHLDKIQSEKILHDVKEMAKNGLRVLGVAKANFYTRHLPSDQHDFQFTFVGLVGLEDPLREQVPAAIQMCREAGIRVIMMTGDYPETAIKIAEKAGIETTNALITGSELNVLSDEVLIEKLKTAHIFARMIPEQKLRVVKLLKKMNLVVGMTGDGVNDAPSLKWADIGISMGARGTDVAREASDIVLLDDNFSSIVAGIERGRLIFSNIRKAMSYIVSIHVPIAGLSFLPVLLNWPLLLLPVHIVFLELIIDPACSLLFESQASENKIMCSPPRSMHKRLFSKNDLIRSFLQGFLVLLSVMVVLWYQKQINQQSEQHTRTLAFVVLVLSNLSLIFADMSGGNPRQITQLLNRTSTRLIIVAVFICLVLFTQVKPIQSLFHFTSLSTWEFFASVMISLAIFIVISFWNRLDVNRSNESQSVT